MTRDDTISAVHETKKMLYSLLVTDKLDLPEAIGIKSYSFFNQSIYNIIINLNLYVRIFYRDLTGIPCPIKLEEVLEGDPNFRVKRLRNMIVQFSEYASRTEDSVAGHWLMEVIDSVYRTIEFLEILNIQSEKRIANA